MKLNITLFGALPFRRISKTAKRQRRTHLKKDAPTVATCSNCGAPLAPHRACTKCGYYKGKEVVDNLLELNKTNVDDSVKYALLLYCMYKIKGGK